MAQAAPRAGRSPIPGPEQPALVDTSLLPAGGLDRATVNGPSSPHSRGPVILAASPAPLLAAGSRLRVSRGRSLRGAGRAGAAAAFLLPRRSRRGCARPPPARPSSIPPALSMSSASAFGARSPRPFCHAPEAEVALGAREPRRGRDHGGPGGGGGAREARVPVAGLQGLHRARQPPGHQRQGPG